MTRVIPKKFNDELDKLEQDATLVFYVLDVSDAYPGAGVHRFYNGLNENAKPVIWQGQQYEPYPSAIDGISFGKSGNGKPTLAVSNITGMITGLIIQYDDLVGCNITMKIVNAKFLDAVNFKNGNPNADPNQETMLTYIVNKMNQINSQVATFELALPGENTRAVIPKRTITANNCQWKYRGVGCGYSGNRYFDYKDGVVSSIDQDVCNHLESGCKKRFGENAALPIGCFLAVDKING